MNSTSTQVHFIAIGGAVMHNLALALHKKGFQVTGSDDEIYDPAKSRLAAAGILPKQMGWSVENIHPKLDAVILGMHAKADNPELLEAQRLGIKVYSFPEYVYEQCKHKQRIVIAGSHGKTSITSIILHVLKYFNRSFDYLVGAQIEGFDLMVQLTSDAPIIIIEGDEYLSSPIERRSKFHFYHPHIALFSGISWDHFNVFPTFESYVKTFEELADALPKAGTILFDETDDILRVIGEKDREDVSKLPYKAHPYMVENGQVSLQTKQGNIPILLFGEHNMKNLEGARLILEKLGIQSAQFYEAIQHFKGAAKRLEKIADNPNLVVYRDFAHAPSKVKATTEATKQLFPTRRLIACYELHTYSSLNQSFLPHYAQTLDAADTAILFFSPQTLAIKQMEPLSEDIIRKAFGREDILVFTDKEALETYLKTQNWFQTNLLLMSSGTFGGMDFLNFAHQLMELPVNEVYPELRVTDEKTDSGGWNGLLKKVKNTLK
ncbi:MAG: UDP-N-acetylmuramate--L-alanine ligase [Spirosomataceae bacterium]